MDHNASELNIPAVANSPPKLDWRVNGRAGVDALLGHPETRKDDWHDDVRTDAGTASGIAPCVHARACTAQSEKDILGRDGNVVARRRGRTERDIGERDYVAAIKSHARSEEHTS